MSVRLFPDTDCRIRRLPHSLRMAILPVFIALSACATNADSLAGTSWQFVEFQSMSDEIGIVRPEDPSLFTMRLVSDGTVSMRLDCNVANGTWSSTAIRNGAEGSFKFGPLASTRALCMPPHLDEQIVRDAEYVVSYVRHEERLFLSLMADGGIYVWESMAND